MKKIRPLVYVSVRFPLIVFAALWLGLLCLAHGQTVDLDSSRKEAQDNDCTDEQLGSVARKPYPKNALEPKDSDGMLCGCVPDLTGETYGLYAYGAGEADNAPAIAFDALTRIGLFWVEGGQLKNSDLWKSVNATAAFIQKAHRHRTRVDLVIYFPDWQTWQKMTTGYKRRAMMDEIVYVVSAAPRFDGVTLYFATYPENEITCAADLKDFLHKLHKKLPSRPTGPHLNLMLPAITKTNETCVGKFLTTLYPLNRNPEKVSDPVTLILTFLNEPTKFEKKQMRYIIEKMFQGKQRVTMLRKIVPIIKLPANPEAQQFNDDLIYFEDNFGGVGFWPAPAAGDDHMSEEIVTPFQPDQQLTFFQRILKDRSRAWCRYICPNRAVIEYVFFTILSILSVWALGACWICELRSLFRRGFWYFMAVVLMEAMILAGLLACDPDWTKNATEVFIALAVALTIFLVFRQISKMKEGKYP